MAKSDKNTLKSWFQNGDYPNQEQFWSWMDSYWHKDEPIPIEMIQGLVALLAGKATDQDIINVNQRIDEIEAGGGGGTPPPETVEYETDGTYLVLNALMLEKLVVIPTATITMSIGTTAGSSDIMFEQECPADTATVVGIDFYAYGGNKNIYLNGITAQTTIKYYKR